MTDIPAFPDADPPDDAPEAEEEDYNWGGDGSDLNEPVRAHVEAALIETDAPYPPPLDELLRLGDPREQPDISTRIGALNLTQAHVSDLVRMARDRKLNTASSESLEVWAPTHALQALEALDSSAVAADLVPLFDLDDDWVPTLLNALFCSGGQAAFVALSTYVQDGTRWNYGRANAIEALGALVAAEPAIRSQTVQLFSTILEQAPKNDPFLNGCLIDGLIDLDATETLPVIRRAFEADAVDEMVVGDWDDVLTEFDLEADPDDPLIQRSAERPQASIAPPPRPAPRRISTAASTPASTRPPIAPAKPKSETKKKTKRKIEAASRKANKKKKRK